MIHDCLSDDRLGTKYFFRASPGEFKAKQLKMIWNTHMTYEANLLLLLFTETWNKKRALAQFAKLRKSLHWIREEKWFMGTLIGKTSYSKCFSDKQKTRFICWVDSRQFMHVTCFEIYSRSPQHLAMRQTREWSFNIVIKPKVKKPRGW